GGQVLVGIAAFEPPAREPGVGWVQGGAPAVRLVNVLVQLQPEVVQRIGGVVGVAQGLRAGDRVRRGVQRRPDRVVGALLPVSRSRRARALADQVGRGECEVSERRRVAHLRRERRGRGGGRGGGGGVGGVGAAPWRPRGGGAGGAGRRPGGGGGAAAARRAQGRIRASTSPQGWEGLCLASCRYPPATPATTMVSTSQPGRDRCWW